MSLEVDALVTFAITLAARRLPVARDWWSRVPDRMRPLLPLLVALLVAMFDGRHHGASPGEAAIVAAWSFLAAMGAHKALRDAPGPYR